jgi:RimJ/RimL family protein N-acetyltransferase
MGIIGRVNSDASGPAPDQPPAALGDVRFRAAAAGDAAGLLALKKKLDQETSFMLLQPGERAEDSASVAADLTRMAGAANCAVIVAASAGRLVGYTEARGGGFRRNRITAHVVIGVLAAASGQGVGSGLLRELELWALAHGIHRLELTVMAHNHRAMRLYERAGFAVEGRRHECLLVDGRLVDELYMAKLLPAGAQPMAAR